MRLWCSPSMGLAALLVIFNTIIPVATKLSRTGQNLYIPSTLVFFIEVFKILVCFSVLYIYSSKNRSICNTLKAILEDSRNDPALFMKMMVIALFYSIQGNVPTTSLLASSPCVCGVDFVRLAYQIGNLNLYAISNLEGFIFLITSQLKVVTTAFFSWLILGRRLSPLQVCSLFILTLGATIVQLSSIDMVASQKSTHAAGNTLLGLLSVLTAATSSGIAGILFEASIRNNQKQSVLPRIWLVNIQLAFSGACFSFLLMVLCDGEIIGRNGILYGHNAFTLVLVLLMVTCGFVIGFIVKHADSIIKGFASAFSVLLSGIIMDVFSSVPGSSFSSCRVIGGSLVIFSILLYNYHAIFKEYSSSLTRHFTSTFPSAFILYKKQHLNK